jgi:hypothetical protein
VAQLVEVQMLPVQICPVAHLAPHAPQLSGSLVKSAHIEPHAICPAGHERRHPPPEQMLPGPHARPHAPQLFGSFMRSAQ